MRCACAHGALMVRSWCAHGALSVRSRCALGALTVRWGAAQLGAPWGCAVTMTINDRRGGVDSHRSMLAPRVAVWCAVAPATKGRTRMYQLHCTTVPPLGNAFTKCGMQCQVASPPQQERARQQVEQGLVCGAAVDSMCLPWGMSSAKRSGRGRGAGRVCVSGTQRHLSEISLTVSRYLERQTQH